MAELRHLLQLFVGPFSSWVVVADAQEIEDLLLRSKLQRAIDSRWVSLIVRKAFVDRFSSSSMIRAGFGGVVSESLVSLKTDDVWKRHKRILAPLMTSTYLIHMSPSISANAQLLVRLDIIYYLCRD